MRIARIRGLLFVTRDAEDLRDRGSPFAVACVYSLPVYQLLLFLQAYVGQPLNPNAAEDIDGRTGKFLHLLPLLCSRYPPEITVTLLLSGCCSNKNHLAACTSAGASARTRDVPYTRVPCRHAISRPHCRRGNYFQLLLPSSAVIRGSPFCSSTRSTRAVSFDHGRYSDKNARFFAKREHPGIFPRRFCQSISIHAFPYFVDLRGGPYPFRRVIYARVE